jgi:hypothetical protein
MKLSFSRALAALFCGFAIVLGGCSDSSEPQVPGSLQIVAGDTQRAVVGTAVAVPPSVKLLTTTGKPLGGAQVTFTSAADGVVTPTQLVTNAQGIATLTSWTLPKRAGSHQLTVSSTGVAPLNVTATALSGPAARMTRASPETQTGAVGSIAGAAPAVFVSDAFDNPVAGITVRFTPSGNGSVGTSTTFTDAIGIARAGVWTLGTFAGDQTVLAEITGGPALSPVVFTAVVAAAPASKLAVVTQPVGTDGSGQRLVVAPVVEVQDNFNNRIASATTPITVSVAPGSTQTLSGTLTVVPVSGRATFNDVVVNGAGSLALQFTAGGLTTTSSASFNVPLTAQCQGTLLTLNYQLGQSTRFIGNGLTTPNCLDFPATLGGQQYLVQFENMSVLGNSDTGVFPGSTTPQPGFPIALSTRTLASMNVASGARVSRVPAGAVHSWDFGAGEIYEIEPAEPVGGAKPAFIKRNIRNLDASTSTAAIAIGDTVIATMEGLPRLGIPTGAQKAVVRYVSPDLIIAEDVRLATLAREGGGTNTPLTMSDMQAIAADYVQYAKVQADLFFGGRYNTNTEASGNPPIAIHSLMYADNIWGYTYPNGNYFVWDFWVGTDGHTKGLNQSIERSANNLVNHEIAHMRHAGLNERAGILVRGNRWLVEGFARASERWPIAMRLLGTTDFSRTGNIVLPGYTTTSLNSLEDVPVYTQASVSLYGGYAASSYLFDYFADQVARTGNANWRTALAEFVMNAGTEFTLNTVINRYLPGLDFGTLFTRARIALYTDDYGSGLPEWTQYHQYQLRASRLTLNPQLDPRNLWRKITPGTEFTDSREIPAGGAFGYILDGTAGAGNTRLTVQLPRTPYSVVSVTRIK